MASKKQLHDATFSAARLREIQSSSAHLPASKRRDYLRTELRRVAGEVPECERFGLFEALVGHFPIEDDPLPEISSAAPEQVLDQLRHALEHLVGPERESFAARAREMLDDTNRVATPPSPVSGDLDELLRYDVEHLPHLKLALTVLKSGKLKCTVPGAIELLNLVKIAAVLIETFGGIEAVFWKIWKAKAPRSTNQDPFGDGFVAETARLLEGKPGASFAGYSRSVSECGQLLVAVLSAIPSAIDLMANEWLNRFAPERIATDVRRADRGAPGGQAEQRFWREYEYRCKDFTPDWLAESFFRNLTESASSMTKS